MLERTVNLAGAPVTVGGADNHRDFWDLADTGRWEPATLEAIARLADGAVYIDVGAWIGPTVLVAARKASVVVAYEPDPVAIAELRRNIASNGFTNVEVRETALLDRDGDLPLSPGRPGAKLGQSGSSLVYGTGCVSVPVTDARTEVRSDLFQRCSLLKIDVEGAEYRLIRRLAPYLRARRPTLLLGIHGVQWGTWRFERLPRPLVAAYRRLRIAAERVPLLWRLRHYPYVYLEVGSDWRRLSIAQRWALSWKFGERGLLLAYQPYPEG